MMEEVLYTIFMDLNKVYGALNRYRCLYILEGIRRGTSGPPHPLGILGQALDGGSRGRIMRGGILRFTGGKEGITTSPHHFKYSGGHSVAALYLVGGRRSGRSGRVGKGGATPLRLFLCGLRPGRIDGPGLAAGGVWHPDRVVQSGGTLDKRR